MKTKRSDWLLKVIYFSEEGHRIINYETLYDMSYRDWETDRMSTRLNSSHSGESRMPSSA